MAKLTPPNLPGPRGGSSTMGIGEPPSSEPSEFVFYYHNDHLGTPLAMTDKNAIVKYSATYYPFGGLLSENVVHSNELRFPGQYHDRETDLHYNWHRHYDPDLGRYLQPDPIGLSGGMNLYGYANQNPLSFIDPMGLNNHRGRSFGESFEYYFTTTNEATFGRYGRTLSGVILSGGVARQVDGITPGQWAMSRFRGMQMNGVQFTAIETGLVVGGTYALKTAFAFLAYESGVAIGSGINAGIDVGIDHIMVNYPEFVMSFLLWTSDLFNADGNTCK